MRLSPLQRAVAMIAMAIAALYASSWRAEAGAYVQTNLVSDIPGLAPVTDPNLQNPWGVSESATSPLWISDQAAGVATLYTLNGVSATRAGGPLVVIIPPGTGIGVGPTGEVNNSIGGVATTSFMITQSGTLAPAHFIFANLNGTISAWTAAPPATAQVQPSTAVAGAIYTGLAIGGTTSAPFLYAANDVAGGGIEVFDGNFNNVTGTTFAGKFVDPSLPAGLVPFNVQNIGGDIYVTYAPPGHAAQTMATAGQGAVAIFDASGNFIKQLISGGQLAAPWGVALAPANFGQFSDDLLVGNFAYGNLSAAGGEINAYDPTNGMFEGTLDSNAAWQGLWALTFGSGSANGGSADILYFTTGLDGETNGLFAAITTPEPSGLALLGAALALLGVCRAGVLRRRA